MSFGRLAAIFGIALLILVVNISFTVLYMVVYGHFIDPGHDPKYYSEHVQVAGPYCGIIGGSFLMFLAGFLIARANERSTARTRTAGVWAAYCFLDFAILAASGLTGSILAMFAVSTVSKAIAGRLGLSCGERKKRIA